MRSERRWLKLRIDRLFESAMSVKDDELRAELAKYLCVLASGFLELSCREILGSYTAKRASPHVTRYVTAQLGRFSSATTGKIADLLTLFDEIAAKRWRQSLDEAEVAALDSIVSNRHLIAHGRSVGLSLHVMEDYYIKAGIAVKTLEKEFPPHK